MITSCPDCNGKLSTRAEVCPHCGYRVGETVRRSAPAWIRCPRCEGENEAHRKACEFCGSLLPPAPRPEPREPARPPEGGGTILVYGVLGLVLCFIFGIVAWVKGNRYVEECRARRVSPEGSATAGRILGIVGTILGILGTGFWGLMFAANG